MTPRQFAALAAAAALSLLAAIAVYSARVPWTGTAAGTGKLFAGLATDASKVARVAITQGGKTAVIEKVGEGWQIKSQDGYPASAEKVRTLLIALADAELVEPKTANPDRFALLDVDDPAAETSSARLIKLEDEGGAVLAEVIVGKQRAGQAGTSVSGTYVRRPGENQSWLANTSISGGAVLRDWANPRVFEVKTETVSRVTVEVEGEPPYVVKRDGMSHTLEAIPAGKKVRYVNVVDNIVEAASFLDLERVRKATGGAGGNAGTVTLELDSGLRIAMKVRNDKDATWTTIEATGEGDAKKAADDIMARTGGWEFEVLPSKVGTMLKRQADLLEDIAAEPDQSGIVPQGPPGADAIPAP